MKEDYTRELEDEREPSAFTAGLSRTSPLLTGCSDDSDLPRLSPIRTRSETDLNTWERSKQKLSIIRPQIVENDGVEELVPRFSLQTDFGMYSTKPGSMFGVADCSEFSLSPEDATTTTSGNCSALSEDIWQMVSSAEFPALNSEITTTTTTATTTTITTDDHNTPTVASSSAGFTNRSFSFLIDSFTTTINKRFSNLAIKVERCASNVARDFGSNMRCASDIKPDNSFFEVEKSAETTHRAVFNAPNKAIWSSTTCVHEELSYEMCFTHNGGQDLYEELESLCNEYAKKINKHRKTLPDCEKSHLDTFMTRLYPILEVMGSPTETEDEGGDSGDMEECRQLIEHINAIDELVGNSVSTATQKERSSILEIANIVANPINVLGSASSIPMTPQTSRCVELYVELESAIEHGKYDLELIHEEGILRMAELSTCCVKYLLEIANALTGRVPESPLLSQQVKWPSNGEQIAFILRTFGIRLIHNLEAVTGAFLAALIGVGNSYDENLRDYHVGQKGNALASDLELDSFSAVRKIQESLRNLMYVVAYTTFTS